jgi:hypothetical protein
MKREAKSEKLLEIAKNLDESINVIENMLSLYAGDEIRKRTFWEFLLRRRSPAETLNKVRANLYKHRANLYKQREKLRKYEMLRGYYTSKNTGIL